MVVAGRHIEETIGTKAHAPPTVCTGAAHTVAHVFVGNVGNDVRTTAGAHQLSALRLQANDPIGARIRRQIRSHEHVDVAISVREVRVDCYSVNSALPFTKQVTSQPAKTQLSRRAAPSSRWQSALTVRDTFRCNSIAAIGSKCEVPGIL